MTTISAVFAFAVKNADYWTDLLSGENYPSELTEDEIRALEAARAHIEASVVALLHAAGTKLAEKLGEPTTRFKGATTAEKKRISLAPPNLKSKLYRIELALDRSDSDKGDTIELYASLVVKKGSLEDLRKALDEEGIAHAVNNYYVYAPGIALEEGKSLDALADEAAERAAGLLKGFDPSTASL